MLVSIDDDLVDQLDEFVVGSSRDCLRGRFASFFIFAQFQQQITDSGAVQLRCVGAAEEGIQHLLEFVFGRDPVEQAAPRE